jgi:hypothetical protein
MSAFDLLVLTSSFNTENLLFLFYKTMRRSIELYLFVRVPWFSSVTSFWSIRTNSIKTMSILTLSNMKFSITFSIRTFIIMSIMTLGILILSIMTLGIMTLSIRTFTIDTLRIILFGIMNINVPDNHFLLSPICVFRTKSFPKDEHSSLYWFEDKA